MSWLAENWHLIVGAFASAGVGGALSRLGSRWFDHLRDKRKQTDDVAIQLVLQQAATIERIEAERRADRETLEDVLHDLRNVEGMFDGLIIALKHAPPEQYPAIIQEVQDARASRKGRRGGDVAERRGALRNEVQTAVSAARVVGDAVGGLGA